MDRGTLFEAVYYPFCDLEGIRYCSCNAGNNAFKEWCVSEKVQLALKAKRQKEIEKALEFSCIPKRWREKTLENLEGQEALKIHINQYLDNFKNFQKEGFGIYLWSHGSGRGKTHILSAMCQEIIKRYAIPCIFMTEEQMYFKIREVFDNPNIPEKERIHKFLDIPCLFLDDFGATKVTAWKAEVMTSLLDYRLGNCLPTFFTSNYSPQEYQNLIAISLSNSRPERIPSRIYEICQGFIIEVKGEDWRKKVSSHI
jgi:primosomal protein DnaI